MGPSPVPKGVEGTGSREAPGSLPAEVLRYRPWLGFKLRMYGRSFEEAFTLGQSCNGPRTQTPLHLTSQAYHLLLSPGESPPPSVLDRTGQDHLKRGLLPPEDLGKNSGL